MSSGKPSEAGSQTNGPAGSTVDSIGSQEDCGRAKVAITPLFNSKDIPASPATGAGDGSFAGVDSTFMSPLEFARRPISGAKATPNRSTRVDRSSNARLISPTVVPILSPPPRTANAAAAKGSAVIPIDCGGGKRVKLSSGSAPRQVVDARTVPAVGGGSCGMTLKSKLAAYGSGSVGSSQRR